MRSAYGAVKTAKFRVESISSGKSTRVSRIVNGEFRLKNQVWAQIESEGYSQRIATDGKAVQVLTKAAGEQADFLVFDYNPDQIHLVLAVNLEVLNFWDYKRQLSTAAGGNMAESDLEIQKNAEWSGRSWLVLKETAHQQQVACDYFIDPKTSLIHRTIVWTLDRSHQISDFRMLSLQINGPVTAENFTNVEGKVGGNGGGA